MNELGSSALSEAELADRMERCVYPNAEFHHADHVRLAWYYLRTHGEVEATRRMQKTILRFAEALGHREKFHATVTIGWMRLTAAALRCSPQVADFSQFIQGHSWLLDVKSLGAFYSRELLNSDQSRSLGVFPDIYPLP
jgi:hypothetical protein